MGIPPPPGPTRRPSGQSGPALRFGSVDAAAEVKSQYTSAVLWAFGLDHAPKLTVPSSDDQRKEEMSGCVRVVVTDLSCQESPALNAPSPPP
jgi:hypothetical protein